jgi:hypothetical protein
MTLVFSSLSLAFSRLLWRKGSARRRAAFLLFLSSAFFFASFVEALPQSHRIELPFQRFQHFVVYRLEHPGRLVIEFPAAKHSRAWSPILPSWLARLEQSRYTEGGQAMVRWCFFFTQASSYRLFRREGRWWLALATQDEASPAWLKEYQRQEPASKEGAFLSLAAEREKQRLAQEMAKKQARKAERQRELVKRADASRAAIQRQAQKEDARWMRWLQAWRDEKEQERPLSLDGYALARRETHEIERIRSQPMRILSIPPFSLPFDPAVESQRVIASILARKDAQMREAAQQREEAKRREEEAKRLEEEKRRELAFEEARKQKEALLIEAAQKQAAAQRWAERQKREALQKAWLAKKQSAAAIWAFHLREMLSFSTLYAPLNRRDELSDLLQRSLPSPQPSAVSQRNSIAEKRERYQKIRSLSSRLWEKFQQEDQQQQGLFQEELAQKARTQALAEASKKEEMKKREIEEALRKQALAEALRKEEALRKQALAGALRKEEALRKQALAEALRKEEAQKQEVILGEKRETRAKEARTAEAKMQEKASAAQQARASEKKQEEHLEASKRWKRPPTLMDAFAELMPLKEAKSALRRGEGKGMPRRLCEAAALRKRGERSCVEKALCARWGRGELSLRKKGRKPLVEGGQRRVCLGKLGKP